MSETSNSAQRVLFHLKKALEITAKARFGNSAVLGIYVWGNVFGIELLGDDLEPIEYPSDSPFTYSLTSQRKIAEQLLQLNQLVDETENKIKNIPNIHRDRFLSIFDPIRSFIAPTSLSVNFIESMHDISERELTTLEFCSDLFEQHFPEKIADEALIQEIVEEIQVQYEQIRNSALNPKLKEILLDLLETMRQAIHEYRIRGVEGLKKGLERILGIYIVNNSEIENFKDNQTVGKTRLLINKFISLYSFAADTVQLLGSGETVKTASELIIRLLNPGP